MQKYEMNLRLFDEAAGAAGSAPAAEAGAASTAEAAGEGGEGRDFDAEFDTMIQGEYKDSYNRRMQKALQEQRKGSRQTEARLKEAEGLLALAAERYRLDGKDFQALRTAIEGDKKYLEEEAMEKGLTVEQLSEFKRMERDNRAFQEQIREAQQRQAFEQRFAEWSEQAQRLKGKFPELDLTQEFQNPQFVRMLDHGVGVETAYQAIHFDELMGGALQHTAVQTEKKVLESIKARGARPAENGAGGSSGAREKLDVTKLTKQQRQELIERARRNPEERISFT